MMEEYGEAERRADYRAYFAGIAPRLEKPPKPSEAFPSLAGLDGGNGSGGRLRREDWPEHWKIHYGSDTEVVRQIHEALAASNLRRMAKKPVIQ